LTGMSARTARQVLRIEANALLRLARRTGRPFEAAVAFLSRTRGRVVVTGMGKSGLVGQKIAATLSSTGTPAWCLHPTEGLHGDIGMVKRVDTVLAISNSGETEELSVLLPHLRKRGCRIVLVTGNPRSSLAKKADVVLDAGVEREACPMNLTPTASTTAALALGDALAVALLEKRGFTEEDFALFHPAGELGRRLQCKVQDIMRRGPAVPRIAASAPVSRAVKQINDKRVGATCVVDAHGRLSGIIVDGDLRRALLRRRDLQRMKARDLMTRRPRTIGPGANLAEALQTMEENAIYQLVVVDKKGRPVGFLHMHDLLGRGRVKVI
jgi:arabinose-5-phosphate isomerase